MLTITQIQIACEISILAYCISVLLTKQGMLLEWYLDFLLWLDTKASWIAKPLGMCEKCLAGQIALWYWVIKHKNICNWEITHLIFPMIIFIALSITVTVFIKKYIE